METIIHWVIHFSFLALLIWLMVDGLSFNWVRRVYQIVYSFAIRVEPHWVIMVDIDNFKPVNDVYGHKKGDRLLRKIGLILLKKSCGKSFRYGGDEFIVLLFWVNETKAFRLAENIRRTIEEKTRVTVSIGIGRFEEEADKALYLAKRHGKNRTRFFESG